MGDCGVTRRFIRVELEAAPGFLISHLPLSCHLKSSKGRQQGQNKSQGPESLLRMKA